MLQSSSSGFKSSTFEPFTIPLPDLRTNPFQEEGNVEGMGDIDRVIEEIVKLMEQYENEEFGFYEEPVTSKIAHNRPERKPIWTPTWN